MGFHSIHSVYDDAARELEQRFFDPAEKPTTNLGTAIRRFKYDNYDHLAETRNFDANEVPFEISGYAIRRDIYDTAHRRAGFLMFDHNDKAVGYGMCIAGAMLPDRAAGTPLCGSSGASMARADEERVSLDDRKQIIQDVRVHRSEVLRLTISISYPRRPAGARAGRVNTIW